MKKTDIPNNLSEPSSPCPTPRAVAAPITPVKPPPARSQSDVFARVEKILTVPSDDNVLFALAKLGTLQTPAARQVAEILRHKPERSDAATTEQKLEFYQSLETALALLRQT